MIKVLYVCPSSGLGGAETFISQTLSQGDKSLYQNHYLLFGPGPLYDSLIQKGAHVSLLNSVPKIYRFSDHKKIQNELKKIINEQNIQLVHSTNSIAAIYSALTCRQMDIPHVWFQHGSTFCWSDRLASLLPHNGLIVNSHYTGKKQRALENPLRFLIPRKLPIEKLLPGTEVVIESDELVCQFKQQLLTKQQLPPETVIVSMLCRIEKRKGIQLLLEALRELKKQKIDQPYFCFIWGLSNKNDDYKKSLEQFLSTHNLPAQLMGETQNVSLSLQSADIIVNASIQPEPFGASIIEGMMLGAIPLVPDEGGPIEIVSNGKDGLIFKSRQADSLARNLKTLVLDAELRQKLSLEAKITAKNKYRAQRAISQLESFYTKVLNS